MTKGEKEQLKLVVRLLALAGEHWGDHHREDGHIGGNYLLDAVAALRPLVSRRELLEDPDLSGLTADECLKKCGGDMLNYIMSCLQCGGVRTINGELPEALAKASIGGDA